MFGVGAPARMLPFQLATLAARAPEGTGWVHEEKLDGYRVQLQIRDKRVRLLSRGGKDWTERFPAIARDARALSARIAVLDGEVVALDENGVSSFQRLQQAMQEPGASPIEYRVFDLLVLDGVDLRRAPLRERHRLLVQAIGRGKGAIRLAHRIRDEDPLDAACRAGLEGIVSKREDAPYEGKRTLTWIKSKCQKEQEFVVVGFTEPKGSREGLGALLLGVREGKELRYAGKVGTGFDSALLRKLRARLARLERRASAVTVGTVPRGAGVHWVRPTVVVEVRFTEWTEDGLLRHPAFKGVREDKRASQVHREEPIAGDDPPVTHPERVIFDRPRITKGDLAAYYAAVAPLMLPHVAGRPLSLLRCPEGLGGECFYQKHWTGAEAAVETTRIEESGGKRRNYAVVRDQAGLLGLVQFGVVEIHPWGSRADRPDAPDRVIFDLDPGPEVPWKAVAEGARELRSMLKRLGLESWLKTTGGKGLHVVLPIARTVDWGVASLFARAVAERLVRDGGAGYVSVASKAARPGKIFVDWLRNSRGATAVAPWSVRARAGAPVSMPVRWEELGDLEGGGAFDVPAALTRARKRALDPWASMLSCRQRLSRAVAAKLD